VSTATSFGQYHDGRSNAMMNVRRYSASGTTQIAADVFFSWIRGGVLYATG